MTRWWWLESIHRDVSQALSLSIVFIYSKYNNSKGKSLEFVTED